MASTTGTTTSSTCDWCYYDRQKCKGKSSTTACIDCVKGQRECLVTPNRPLPTRAGNPGHLTTRVRMAAFKKDREDSASATPSASASATTMASSDASADESRDDASNSSPFDGFESNSQSPKAKKKSKRQIISRNGEVWGAGDKVDVNTNIMGGAIDLGAISRRGVIKSGHGMGKSKAAKKGNAASKASTANNKLPEPADVTTSFKRWLADDEKDEDAQGLEYLFACCTKVEPIRKANNQSELDLGALLKAFSGHNPDQVLDTDNNPNVRGYGNCQYIFCLQNQPTETTKQGVVLSTKMFGYRGYIPGHKTQFFQIIGSHKPETVHPSDVCYKEKQIVKQSSHRDILGQYFFRLPFRAEYRCPEHTEQIWTVFELAYWNGQDYVDKGFEGNLEVKLAQFVVEMKIPRDQHST